MDFFKYIKEHALKSKKGTSVVIFALALTFIAACAALTIDIGAATADKSKLSTAVDAAALAGMQELISGSGNAKNVAKSYVGKNMGTIKTVNTDIVDLTNADKTKTKTVTVTGSKTTENYFLKVLGLSLGDINATATAQAGNITALSGIRPLSIVDPKINFNYGVLYTLKEGGGDGTNGCYGALRLGDSTGGSDYLTLFKEGYPGTVHVNDKINAEPGNMKGPTKEAVNYLVKQCTDGCTYLSYTPNCPRIILIPVVDTLAKEVTVLGFATFFLEGAATAKDSDEVYGRFLKNIAESETSSNISVNDYGTYGMRLIK